MSQKRTWKKCTNIKPRELSYGPKPAGITKVKKNSKYFFNLEKRHFKRKVISQLCRADNTTLTSDNDILQECVDFYSKLYSSRSIHNESDNLRSFPDDNFVRLDEDSKKHPMKVF